MNMGGLWVCQILEAMHDSTVTSITGAGRWAKPRIDALTAENMKPDHPVLIHKDNTSQDGVFWDRGVGRRATAP